MATTSRMMSTKAQIHICRHISRTLRPSTSFQALSTLSVESRHRNEQKRTLSCCHQNKKAALGTTLRATLSAFPHEDAYAFQRRFVRFSSTSAPLASLDVDDEDDDTTLQGKDVCHLMEFDASGIQLWSKERLAYTTKPHHMKRFMKDIYLRLDRQCGILDELEAYVESTIAPALRNVSEGAVVSAAMSHAWWSSDDSPKEEKATESKKPSSSVSQHEIDVAIEGILKNIKDLKVLHKDTSRQCRQMHENLPSPIPNSLESYELTPLQHNALKQVCKEVYARHALTIESMAEMVIDLRGVLLASGIEEGAAYLEHAKTHVYAFLRSRLMTQLLCDHVVDCNPSPSNTAVSAPPKPHGAISVDTDLKTLVEQAVTEASCLVEAHFLAQPSVHVETLTDNITCTLVRPWLQYTLVEMLKNSLAITVERDRRHSSHEHKQDEEDPHEEDAGFYPIYVYISETDTDLVIQIMDQGGGLSWKAGSDSAASANTPTVSIDEGTTGDLSKKKLFEFANCTHKWDRIQDQQTYAAARSPVRGLGVGLALSRLHMERFGGTLEIEDRPAYDPTLKLESGVTVNLTIPKNFAANETDVWKRFDSR